MLDAVQDHILVIAENNVAVLAHQLHDQNLVAHVAQLVEMLQLKFHYTFQFRLADGCDPCTADVLAKKHAEVGGSEGTDPVLACEIDQGKGSTG